MQPDTAARSDTTVTGTTGTIGTVATYETSVGMAGDTTTSATSAGAVMGTLGMAADSGSTVAAMTRPASDEMTEIAAATCLYTHAGVAAEGRPSRDGIP